MRDTLIGIESFDSIEELNINFSITYSDYSEEELKHAHNTFFKKLLWIADDGGGSFYFLGIAPDNFGEIWVCCQDVDGTNVEKIADSFNQFIEKTYYLEED